MTIAVLWFWLYLHVKLENQAISVFNWIKLCSSLPCAEQKLSRCRERERERERCVCRAEQKLSRCRERERERERCVCRAEQKLSREREMCVRAEQKLSRCRERERERDVCAMLNRNWADVEKERDVCAHAEPEQTDGDRGVCARAGKARPRARPAVPAILGD